LSDKLAKLVANHARDYDPAVATPDSIQLEADAKAPYDRALLANPRFPTLDCLKADEVAVASLGLSRLPSMRRTHHDSCRYCQSVVAFSQPDDRIKQFIQTAWDEAREPALAQVPVLSPRPALGDLRWGFPASLGGVSALLRTGFVYAQNAALVAILLAGLLFGLSANARNQVATLWGAPTIAIIQGTVAGIDGKVAGIDGKLGSVDNRVEEMSKLVQGLQKSVGKLQHQRSAIVASKPIVATNSLTDSLRNWWTGSDQPIVSLTSQNYELISDNSSHLLQDYLARAADLSYEIPKEERKQALEKISGLDAQIAKLRKERAEVIYRALAESEKTKQSENAKASEAAPGHKELHRSTADAIHPPAAAPMPSGK